LAQGLGKGTVSVMSHEYFHAWNVKRIRSKVLGPFDYLVLPKTGALWLLEGVTDYYANLLLYRYDVFDEAYMKDEIIGNVRTTRANPARFEVSPYDSSYRVGEAANGRGNSAGFGVNYYNTGWLVGLCLDLEIRDRTKGAKSLDDLMYALYEQCKDDRAGFEEDDIRKHLIKIAGEGMGEVYDQWVMSPGELPVESQLRKVGYEMKSTVTKFADVGFPLNWADGKVTATTGNRSGQVRSGDEIVEINGVGKGSTPESSAQVWGQWRTMLVPGSRVNLVLMRGSERVELSVDVVETTRTAYSIEDGSLNDSLRTLRQGWWKGGRKLW
jgi:predicted metalloprotease with PDZ domain